MRSMEELPNPRNIKIPFNLLQTSELDIHLFHSILEPRSIRRRLPITPSVVISHEAIHQIIPPELEGLTHFERLNMLHQIPELGVVVVGNQVGRVGILTMTRCERKKFFGFKMEAILPFKSQEALEQRPEVPLMGIAVSPMQGHYPTNPNDSPGSSPAAHTSATYSRRYRLLMIYCDKTVLSYEISRPAPDVDIVIS